MNEKSIATIIEPSELYARAIDSLELEIEDWRGYYAGSIYKVDDLLDEMIGPLELKRDALMVLYTEETGEVYKRVLFIDREKPKLPDKNSGREVRNSLQE